MKIGISCGKPWGEQSYLKIKQFGFDSYDFNMSNTDAKYYSYVGAEFERYFKNEKKVADEADVSIWQVHGPWRHPPMDETKEQRDERFEKMKLSMHGAAILGAKYWVIHPIMPFGVRDIEAKQEEKTLELNFEFMNRLLVAAKQEGIVICLENMPFRAFSLSSPAAIAELVKEMNDPSFAMCLDTGHTNVSPDRPTPAECIRQYGDIIKVLHVHDNKGQQDEHSMPFYGNIDWKDFSMALKETGFDGALSLECAPPSKLPDGILEDMYCVYANAAKAIACGKL